MPFARALGSSNQPFLLFIARSTLASVVPALLIGAFEIGGLKLAGVDLGVVYSRSLSSGVEAVFGYLLFAPVFETLLLAWAITLVLSTGVTPLRGSLYVAIAAGLLHALNGPLAILPTTWSFIVFSYSYILWRCHSLQFALAAAAIPHVLHNLIALLIRSVV